MLHLFPNKTKRKTPYRPRHKGTFQKSVSHATLPFAFKRSTICWRWCKKPNQPKITARRTGEYMHLRCQVYMSLYWIQIALHIKAIELKWNMKLNYCSISFHIFLSFTAKNGYAWLMLLYDKCEWKYIVLYTMHLTYCKHCQRPFIAC